MKKSGLKWLAFTMMFMVMALSFSACGESPNVVNPESSIVEQEGSSTKSYVFEIGTQLNDPSVGGNFNPSGQMLLDFKNILAEKSEGRVTVDAYWSSSLGGMDELFDMMRVGEIDMVCSAASSVADKRFSVFNIPGLVSSYEMAYDLMGTTDSPLYQVYQEVLNENNVQGLAGSIGTIRGLFNSEKEVHLPSDVKDLMIRTYNDKTVTTYWKGLSNTVVLPMSELYTGLQLGSVDGFEIAPAAAVANSLHEVVSYYTDINWQWQIMPSLMMSKQLYDSLDTETISVIEESAQEAVEKYYINIVSDLDSVYTFLEENDVSIYKLTDEERDAWDEYGQSLYSQFEADHDPALFQRVKEICSNYNK